MRLSLEQLGILALTIIIGLLGGAIFMIRRPKHLKVDLFINSWKELQNYCRDRTTWPLAITSADKLLDAALKKRKLKGRTMGERLVAAQRIFIDNDDVWFAHNLAKKISAGNSTNLKESEVKDALMGFRNALQDIGALPPNQEAKHEK